MIKLLALVVFVALCAIGLVESNPTIEQVSGTINGASSSLSSEQPYHTKIAPDKTEEIFLDINYSLGQNSVFVIEPMPIRGWENDICIEKILLSSHVINQAPICSQTILNFIPYLQEGPNRIVLQLHSKPPKQPHGEQPEDASIYIYPQLWGAQAVSTAACLGLLLAAAVLCFYVARHTGLDKGACMILTLGLPYFGYWLHYYPNLRYTPDIPGHLAYTLYMIHHWMQPYEYKGHEDFHPPLYYFFTSRVFSLFSAAGPVSPLTAIRTMSLTMYMVFCLYGLRTLKLTTTSKGGIYYVACLLIVFWPVSIIKATIINDDIAMYALWGAAFYYLARWFSDHRISGLQIAVALTGIMFMVKSNAWVPLGVVGACALYGIYSKRLLWRQLIQKKNLMVGGLLMVGILVNFGRIIYMYFVHSSNDVMNYFGHPRQDVHPAAYFMQFDLTDFIIHPYITFDHEPAFLNFFLKTMLYHEWGWRHLALAQALNIIVLLWLLTIICTVVVAFIHNRLTLDKAWPYLVGVVISYLSSIGFMVVDRYMFCQNFRYVLPMLVPLVILWVRGMETASEVRALKPLYWIGITSGILLPAGAMALYLAQ